MKSLFAFNSFMRYNFKIYITLIIVFVDVSIECLYTYIVLIYYLYQLSIAISLPHSCNDSSVEDNISVLMPPEVSLNKFVYISFLIGLRNTRYLY